MKLWKQVLIGLFLGVISGMVLGEKAVGLKIFGTIFISLVKMVIVPLIFCALLSGITSMQGQGNLTRVGIKGFASYLLTAVFAVMIGLAAGLIFKPGAGIDLNSLLSSSKTVVTLAATPPSVTEFLLNLIPTNPLNAMAQDYFLQVIIFSIFTGITINMIGEKGNPVKDVIASASQVMFKMIEIIIRLAPLGAFGYIAWVVGTQGLDILKALVMLVIALLAACVVQYLIFGLLILTIGRLSPMPFYKKILLTQSIAFA